MLESKLQQSRTEPGGAFGLVRRLLTEYGVARWQGYAIAFGLMGVAAACTGLYAYLAGDIVNQAYVKRDLTGVVVAGVLALLMFTLRGAAIYGQAVMLSRIGNSIVAENQRRLFSKLLQQNLGFFADHHSSEFIARLTTGADTSPSVTIVCNPQMGSSFSERGRRRASSALSSAINSVSINKLLNAWCSISAAGGARTTSA